MNIQVIEHENLRILEPLSEISKVDDALELVAASMEHQTGFVLLDASMLSPSFFDLRTRFAGEFLQKLQNYQLRTAGVFPDQNYSERFQEFLLEAKRGQMFRVFEARAEAFGWLAAQ